jgi:hypothetical protein
MSRNLSLWRLTPAGKKVTSRTSRGGRIPVLDALHNLGKVATLEEVALQTGARDKYSVRVELKKYARKGLVEEVTREG